MKPSTTLVSIVGAMAMAGLSAFVQTWQLPVELIGAVGTIIAALPAISERVKKMKEGK